MPTNTVTKRTAVNFMMQNPKEDAMVWSGSPGLKYLAIKVGGGYNTIVHGLEVDAGFKLRKPEFWWLQKPWKKGGSKKGKRLCNQPNEIRIVPGIKKGLMGPEKMICKCLKLSNFVFF